MTYNWQQPDWPNFQYSTEQIEGALFQFAEETGYVTGMLVSVPEDIQLEIVINAMVAEAIKTSAIEGEFYSRKDVTSSIRNKLGLSHQTLKDKKAGAVGELMVEVRNTYKEPLSKDVLCYWHTLLLNGRKNITPGEWRKGNEPMQIISGPLGKETVHFEAPPSGTVSKEMTRFIKWFNETAPGGKSEIRNPVIRSAIAHLYFETIHPFEDGNGRIGRAISEKALSQTLGRPVLLSLSNVMEADKTAYYKHLKFSQQSNEITDWIIYFVTTVLKAQLQMKQIVLFTLSKTKFLDYHLPNLNDRQVKVISKMIDAGPEGFEGGMTAKKYISIAKTSKATATRDLQELVESGVLINSGGGRSIHYILSNFL